VASPTQRREARRLLALAASQHPPQTQRLLLAAAISAVFEKSPVVVGGTAEEHWLSQESQATDLDLCPRPSNQDIRELERLGFKRDGRHWVHEKVIHGVEFPGAGDDINRTVDVPISGAGGARVTMIGLEDLYLDRLRQSTASETARHSQRLDSIVMLLVVQRAALDRDYVTFQIAAITVAEPMVGRAMQLMQRRAQTRARRILAERRAREIKGEGSGNDP
jgi:hypothetical protein